jgi:hypothetical protein
MLDQCIQIGCLESITAQGEEDDAEGFEGTAVNLPLLPILIVSPGGLHLGQEGRDDGRVVALEGRASGAGKGTEGGQELGAKVHGGRLRGSQEAHDPTKETVKVRGQGRGFNALGKVDEGSGCMRLDTGVGGGAEEADEGLEGFIPVPCLDGSIKVGAKLTKGMASSVLNTCVGIGE